ncbi:hypothetical protein Q3G72_022414 [Acer saccharum]|nr:hypothetical protein Q3G72_022414 [Acer saccharum]
MSQNDDNKPPIGSDPPLPPRIDAEHISNNQLPANQYLLPPHQEEVEPCMMLTYRETHKGRFQSKIHGRTLDAPMKAPKEKQVDIKEHNASAARRRCARGKAKVGKKAETGRQAVSIHSLMKSSNPESSNKSDR